MTTLLYRQESIVFWRKLAPLVGLELPVNGVNHYATVDCRICPHNWWGEEPRILDTFVEKYSFEGITVIPFCTSASSGIGRSGSNMESLAGSGTWLEGERFSGNVSEEELQAWIGGLG